MDHRHLPAVAGFAFVAAWAAFGLLTALACLLGAAAFQAGFLLLRGELSLAELRERADNARAGFSAPPRIR